ncbi:MAG: metallophosphoesterase [Sphaerochaeta sp.]
MGEKKASEDSNTFIISEEYEKASSFTMLLTSDQHFNREDSGVYYEDNLFLDWVSTYQSEHQIDDTEKHLFRMVSLGDITDNSKAEEFQKFVLLKDKLADQGIATYVVKGNHDIRPGTNCIADWRTYVGQYSYQAFAYSGVSFYLLNTAARTLGRIQMQELQEAVKLDDKRPKLFFSHVPLYGKPLLLYTVMCDTQERDNLIRLMVDNKVMLFLAGHHHQGDVLYRFRQTTSEFILGAFHGRGSLIEQIRPRWYLLHFSSEDKKITITRFQVECDRKITEKVMAIFAVEL